ncbi:MAG: alpha/beta hydrolase [Lachnospiraceae bacterium]|nr:alpha/beta hydrolase [Lachnospiraceae bacterium]
MNKVAVFFPGIGYTVDKPLMHYGRKLAKQLGYEEIPLPYTGFPPKIQGDAGRMQQSFEIALAQAEEMLKDVDFSTYEDILFIGKSIGTIVAAKLASESAVRDRIRLVFYTPLPETFAYSFGESIVFTGNDDPWVGRENSRIPTICWQKNIPCHIIEGANHSLESTDPILDIKNLRKVMKKTRKFILGE